MPWAVSYVTSLVALVLSVAAVSKFVDRRSLVAVVQNYQLVSPALARGIGRWLPEIEGLAAALLFMRVGAVWAGLAAAVLFLAFAAAVAANLIRGRSHIACGCFGPSAGTRLTWGHVASNVVLASGALFAASTALFGPAASSLPFMDHAAATLAAVVTLTCWWLGSLSMQIWRRASINAESS